MEQLDIQKSMYYHMLDEKFEEYANKNKLKNICENHASLMFAKRIFIEAYMLGRTDEITANQILLQKIIKEREKKSLNDQSVEWSRLFLQW